MTKSTTHDQWFRVRGWGLAIFAIAAWALLATNSAEAQSVQIPDFVMAQVLGPAATRGVEPSRKPAASPAVNLVAHRMRQHFEDQLVAGVNRPSVELEVHFDFDSEQIHEAGGAQIEAAAEMLKVYFPATRFRVAGYTDAAGSDEYNQQLSERRAIAVWQLLIEEHGVNADRLERVGYGEQDPSLEGTDAQRRRVELQIIRGEREAG